MATDDYARRDKLHKNNDARSASPLAQPSHEDEIALLNRTISQLTSTIEEHSRGGDSSEAIAELVRQQRDANEHLVLATMEARELQAAAETANKRQIEFLSMLAHELRNPLQPMAMATNLLSAHVELHPTIAKVHDVYSRQIGHMERLVNDLLDASRVSSGKITMQLAPVLLSDILEDAVETCLPGIERRHQRLQITLPDSPLTIQGDLIRLAQVFSNLLINASKFTQEYGNIEVGAQRVGDTVEVWVSDDGAGIPPELLPFVFDLFTQGYRSLERAQGGLGIGLSLVRSITQLHGGSATVVSEGIGNGSKFIITLPLSPLMVTAPVTSAAASRLPIAPCRILLIEDNIDSNELMTSLLQQDGHVVTSCFDGPSGLRSGLSQPYDVVLCDIGLPGMDGFQVVSALHAALEAPQPCFIATTGYSAAAQIDRASEAGFDHYLVKPVNMDSLNFIIQENVAKVRDPLNGQLDLTTATWPKKRQ